MESAYTDSLSLKDRLCRVGADGLKNEEKDCACDLDNLCPSIDCYAEKCRAARYTSCDGCNDLTNFARKSCIRCNGRGWVLTCMDAS